MKLCVLLIVLSLAQLFLSRAEAAGFQLRTISDADNRPITVGIWYPSRDPATAQRELGFAAAINGAVEGSGLGLVIISHGNGGVFNGHRDTALALADAGFVVAAPTHPGDNYQDESLIASARWFTDRPRHVQRVIDYMLSGWPEHARLDTQRVGFFGFSKGGSTGLALLGAVPDASRIRMFCSAQPQAFVCRALRENNNEVLEETRQLETTRLQDVRIKAAVLAAPGYPYAFVPESLSRITVPIQLWSAGFDDRAPSEDVSELRRLLPTQPEYHSVEGAGHFSFLPPCPARTRANLPLICSDAPGFDRAAFHERFNRSVVQFFAIQLGSR